MGLFSLTLESESAFGEGGRLPVGMRVVLRIESCGAFFINQRVVAQRLPDRVLRGRGGTDLEVRLRLRHVAGTRRERRGAGPGRTGLGRQPPLLLVPFPHRFTPRR